VGHGNEHERGKRKGKWKKGQNKFYHNKKINLEKYHAKGEFLEMPNY
jgi:hypothetical protein